MGIIKDSIAKQDGVLPVEVLSGKLQVETLFLIQGKVLRIYKNLNILFNFILLH